MELSSLLWFITVLQRLLMPLSEIVNPEHACVFTASCIAQKETH